jgi:hypothetical protein
LRSHTETKTTVAAQPAYRVRTYLENRALGQGWLLPGRSTTNASGELVYEPVVVLDPSTRSMLATDAAKETEPAPPTSVTVNHNYPSTYDNVWPAYWVSVRGQKGHRHKPGETPQTLQPPVSPPVSPFLSTRIWQPQTGFQQMPRGRPGGEWISSAPRGHSYISSGAGTGVGTFPARF